MRLGHDVQERSGQRGQCVQASTTASAAATGGPPGHRVQLRREPGEHGGRVERVEAQQPYDRRGGPADRLVRRAVRRVLGRRALRRGRRGRGRPADARRAAGRRPARRVRADGQVARAARINWRPSLRAVARSAGDGVRASAASSSASGSWPAAAAAASAAAVSPAVCSRPRQNSSRSAASRTRPALTAASAPPEWAWPPAGKRPSARTSRAARLMCAGTRQKRKYRWAMGVRRRARAPPRLRRWSR